MNLKKSLSKTWKILKQTGVEFFNDDPMGYSASIAFYTIFSMPAILIITVTIAGSAYEQQTVQGGLMEQIETLIGPQSAEEVKKILENARNTTSSTLAKIVGIATLVFSATTVFVSLQNGLNKIWGIKPKPERGVVKFIMNRLLSLAMVISIGFLLLVSLLVDTIVVVFRNILSEFLSGMTYYFVAAFNIAFSLLVITLVFAMIYKVLPDARIKWRTVWVGAFVTTLLFSLGKYLIGFYLGNSSVGSAYGAAGSLVLLLIWVYYSSVLILFGAEFTYVYSRHYGHRIRPDKDAVIVKVQEVEEEDGVVNA
ncbi:YihY/virulence factor BrkB family protein [Fulvivirga kasyanovii]|uniref:YihY/virulence factor BrkB family protein n=1 Tax=Fulvivirga kasyanovii TaxID=396812 RepID=A0ABW9RXA8_9BACT|nr:YihY/virulence factor BrkB family protein [Fulvivirga kasyanovii]MTI28897.1 YihY/virulence factor BrkB family protein [Fulvivirga kasyanovii]